MCCGNHSVELVVPRCTRQHHRVRASAAHSSSREHSAAHPFIRVQPSPLHAMFPILSRAASRTARSAATVAAAATQRTAVATVTRRAQACSAQSSSVRNMHSGQSHTQSRCIRYALPLRTAACCGQCVLTARTHASDALRTCSPAHHTDSDSLRRARMPCASAQLLACAPPLPPLLPPPPWPPSVAPLLASW